MPLIEQIPQLPPPLARSWQRYLLETLLATGGALAITGLLALFHLYPMIPNISLVYLLLILVLASTYGRYAAVLASVIALLSFDFFLVPPLYTLVIFRWEEWIALFVFLVAALFAGQLAAQARENLAQAKLREREFWILYEVVHVLNSTPRLDEQLESIVLALVRVFSVWGVRDAPMRVERFTLSPDEWESASEVLKQGQVKERTDSRAPGHPLSLRMVPLKTATSVLGVLCMRIEPGVSWFASRKALVEIPGQPHEQMMFFRTFLDEAVMKLEQARLQGNADLSPE